MYSNFFSSFSAKISLLICFFSVGLSDIDISRRLQSSLINQDIQVNTVTTGDQEFPAACSLEDGASFVIVWDSDNKDGSGKAVVARKFKKDGTSISAEIQVNSYTLNDQFNAAVCSLAGGNSFVVAYVVNGLDGDTEGVYATIFNADMTVLKPEFMIPASGTGSQKNPEVACLQNGTSFVVTWEDNVIEGSTLGVAVRIFFANGNVKTGQFLANTYTTDDQENAVVAPIYYNNYFVVLWQSNLQIGQNREVYGAIFDASDGSRKSTEFKVNEYTTGNQRNPTVCSLKDGLSFVVAWRSNGQDTNGDGIYAKIYKYDLSIIKAEFKVNDYITGDQQKPNVRALNGGMHFVITWHSASQDTAGFGIIAKVYDQLGNAVSNESIVNKHTTSDQINPVAAVFNDETSFAIAWQSTAQDTGGEGIFFRLFDNLISFSATMSVNPIFSNQPSGFVFTAPTLDPPLFITSGFDCNRFYNPSTSTSCVSQATAFSGWNSGGGYTIAFTNYNNPSPFSNISNYMYNFTIKTALASKSFDLNLTVYDKTWYIDDYCSTKPLKSCVFCLTAASSYDYILMTSGIYSTCLECYTDSHCNSSKPACISNVCVTTRITGSILRATETIIFQQASLALNSQVTDIYPTSTVTYEWSCTMNSSITSETDCPDPSNIFVQGSSASKNVSSSYFSSVSTTNSPFTFHYRVNFTTVYNSSYAEISITVHDRTNYLANYCQTSPVKTCFECLMAGSLTYPSQVSTQIALCAECYTNFHCSLPKPVCISNACTYNSISGNLTSEKNLRFNDRPFSLDVNVIENIGNPNLTYAWKCTITTLTITQDLASFSIPDSNQTAYVAGTFLSSIVSNKSELNFMVNISSQFNYSIVSKQITVVDRYSYFYEFCGWNNQSICFYCLYSKNLDFPSDSSTAISSCNECYINQHCPYQSPICKAGFCTYTNFSVVISTNSTLVFDDLDLYVQVQVLQNDPLLSINSDWICKKNVTLSLFSVCTPDVFIISNNSSKLSPATLNTSNNQTTYELMVNSSTFYNHSTSILTVNVVKRSYYIAQFCQTQNKITCYECLILSNLKYPSESSSKILTCPQCYRDEHCSMPNPSCTNDICIPTNLKASIISSSTFYSDEEIILTALALENYPSYQLNYKWQCKMIINQSSIDCLDSNQYFDKVTNLSSMILPKLYLEGATISKNSTLYEFTLNMSTKFDYSLAKYNITVYDRFYFIIQPNVYYTNIFNYSITGVLNNSTTIFDNFTWHLSPTLPQTSIKNNMLVKKNAYTFNPSESNLIILLSATNQSRHFTSKILIPVNYPPLNGSLVINPTKGKSLSSNFSLSASSWKDFDPPLSFRFLYTYNLSVSSIYLNEYSYSPNLNTLLPGDAVSENITLILWIKDTYGAQTEHHNITICQNSYSNLLLTIAQIDSVMSSLSLKNLSNQDVTLLQIITQELTQFEKYHLNSSDNSISKLDDVCPFCSGNGYCPSDRCVCNITWGFYDCSILQTTLDDMSKQKLELLNTLNTYLLDTSVRNDSRLTSILKELAENPDFNDNKTLSKVQEILENTIKITDSNTRLTDSQINDISEIIDSFYRYVATYDCNNPSNFSLQLLNSSANYINAISNNMLLNSASNESVINQDTYDLYVGQATTCQLANKRISTNSGNSPDITIVLNLTNYTQNCSKEVFIKYFALDANLLACNATANTVKSFSNIAISFTDPSTKQVIDNILPTISLIFKQPSQVNCDSICSLNGLVCICPDLSLFDVKSQFSNIFAKSQLKNLFKFGSLSKINLLGTIPFWFLVGYLIFTTISILFLWNKDQYDAVDNYIKRKKHTKCKTILLIYFSAQSLIQIYICEEDLPKRVKIYVYYLRSLLMLAFTSIFGISDDATTDDVFPSLVTLDFSFQPYIFMVSYITVIPACYFIEKIYTKAWAKPKLGLVQNKPKMTEKRKKFCAIFTGTILIVFCNFAVIIITPSMTQAMINQWIINFIVVQLQDFTINPLIQIFMTFICSIVCRKIDKSKFKRLHAFSLSIIVMDVMRLFYIRKLADYYKRKQNKRRVKRVENPKSKMKKTNSTDGKPQIDMGISITDLDVIQTNNTDNIRYLSKEEISLHTQNAIITKKR